MTIVSEAQIRAILERQSPAALIEVATSTRQILGKATPQQALKLFDTSHWSWVADARMGQKKQRIFVLYPRFAAYPRSEASVTTLGKPWDKSHHKRCFLWSTRA
jgi:hypothetical protein